MNKRMIDKVLDKWYLFFIWCLVAVIASVGIIDLRLKPKNEEVFSVFLSGYSLDKAKIQNSLESVSPDYVREINVYTVEITDEYFGVYYATNGTMKCDIAIIPEERLNNDTIEGSYLVLNTEYLEKYNLPTDYYYVNDKVYGIKVFDKEKDDNNSFISYTKDGNDKQDYYAFFFMYSYHTGELNSRKYDTAFKMLEVIVNYE